MNQDDFRKLFATPRSDSPSTLTTLTPPAVRKQSSNVKNLPRNPFLRPPKIPKTTGTPTINKSHVNLGPGFRDRAQERRLLERAQNQESAPTKGLDFDAVERTSDEEEEGNDNLDGKEEDDELDTLLEKAERGTNEQKGTEDDIDAQESKPQEKRRFKPIIPKSQKPPQKKLKLESNPKVSPSPTSVEPPQLSAEIGNSESSVRVVPAGSLASLSSSPHKTMSSMPPPPVPSKKISKPPPIPKKSRENLLAELRATQANKKAVVQSTTAITSQDEGMWSDEDELSDYDPFHDLPPDEDSTTATKTLKDDGLDTLEIDQGLKKRNYFVEEEEGEILKPKPLELDPTIAAVLRKVSQSQQLNGKEHEISTSMRPKRMRENSLDVITESSEEEKEKSKETNGLGSRTQDSGRKGFGMSLLGDGDAYDDVGKEEFGVWGDDDEDMTKKRRKRQNK